jgi:hypothetical protein
MAEDLFARLSAIGSIIGGGSSSVGLLEPDEPADDEGVSAGGKSPTGAPSGFTGGTMTEAHGDSGGDTPGARALQTHLLGRFAGGRDSGVYADRDVRGRPGVRSVHGEGRAGDFGITVGDPLGDQVAAYLVGNADRFGVQRIIYNHKSWNRKTRTWKAYNGENPHTDHVHWEITPEAAGRPDLYGDKGGDTATNTPVDTDDLFSRASAIHDVIGGRGPKRASAQRDGMGFRNVSKDMAQRFAAARSGRQSIRTSQDGAASFDTGTKGQYQQHAFSMFERYGWSEAELGPLIELWNRESGWNPNAKNPSSSATGIAQKITKLHGPIESSWQGQIAWGLDYIARRYGSPSAALAFWQRAVPINGRNVGHWY